MRQKITITLTLTDRERRALAYYIQGGNASNARPITMRGAAREARKLLRAELSSIVDLYADELKLNA